jgi:hypothetical protein
MLMALSTRYRIWFSAGVASHGGPETDPKKSQQRKWCDEKNSGQREQSQPVSRGRYRARTESPCRQGHRRELNYSDDLVKRRHAQRPNSADDDCQNKNAKEEPVTKTLHGVTVYPFSQ